MTSVFDPVRRHAAVAPDNIALRAATDQWTYLQLQDTSMRYAGALVAAGLSPGDRVLLAAPSVPEFVVAYLGIQAAGCVVVPVNTMSTRAEVEYVLGDAGCSSAIRWHTLGPAVGEAAEALSVPCWTLSPGAAVTAAPAGVVDRDRDETAAILYTSGTTGRPKGAQLTVGNLLSAGEIGAECSRASSGDRTGTGLPLFHVFGQASVMMATLTVGGSMSLLARFEPASMLEMLRRDRLAIMAGVPTMWNAMLHAAGYANSADFAGLRVAVSGGASLPGGGSPGPSRPASAAPSSKAMGSPRPPRSAPSTTSTAAARRGTPAGQVPRMQVQVRDGDGKECPPGTVGEVHI
nr:AMP-binding protein [Streptomyces sp. SID5914]